MRFGAIENSADWFLRLIVISFIITAGLFLSSCVTQRHFYRDGAFAPISMNYSEWEKASKKPDYKTLLSNWMVQAERGDAEIQNGLGIILYKGYGVRQDIGGALEWFHRAAEQGHIDAQRHLAILYLTGSRPDYYTGVRKLDPDYPKAIKLFHQVVERGHALAQADLAYLYLNGYVVSKDIQTSINWYARASEQGNTDAMIALGDLYMDGKQKGIEKSGKEAFKWYELAAKEGDAVGQFNIAEMHRTGFGVPQDYSVAIKWYLRAANSTADEGWSSKHYELRSARKKSQVQLAEIFKEGLSVPQDYAEAFKWYKRAAENNSAEAQLQLAEMYKKGIGTPKNHKEALKWYKRWAN